MNPLAMEVWSDIACPWCYVGKRRLEAAIEAFEGEVSVTWRAFELDPGAPKEAPERVDYAGRLAAKYRASRDEAQAMIDRMVGVGRSVGVEMRFDRIRPTNTFDAHRLLAWAAGLGRQSELGERLFAAYLCEGLAISDPEVLARLAGDAGLDPGAAAVVLAGDAHGEAVREDEALAARLGIRGVPFFVFDHRLGVSGAQPAEELLAAMRRAVEEGDPVAVERPTAGECGPEGCDVEPATDRDAG